MRLVLSALLLSGCLGPVAEPPPLPRPGAQAQSTVAADAGSPVPALLQQKCAECHARDGGYELQWVGSRAVLESASKLCSGERVADCVAHAVAAQEPEGSRCRTYVVRPFHREGWECLSAAEIASIVAWVDAGMPE